jgi:hypothetical protein
LESNSSQISFVEATNGYTVAVRINASTSLPLLVIQENRPISWYYTYFSQYFLSDFVVVWRAWSITHNSAYHKLRWILAVALAVTLGKSGFY